jgi:hypothetical protein
VTTPMPCVITLPTAARAMAPGTPLVEANTPPEAQWSELKAPAP